MPPLETVGFRITVVIWEAWETRDNYGEVRVKPPREIIVDWTDNIRTIMGPLSNPVQIDATMATAEPIANSSIVFQGTLAESNNIQPQLLMQIIKPNENFDLKGRQVRREYNMMRFRDSLPTISNSG